MWETKIGRRDALKGLALATWAAAIAALSLAEGLAPLPSLSVMNTQLSAPHKAVVVLSQPATVGYAALTETAPAAGRVALVDMEAARALPSATGVYPRRPGGTGRRITEHGRVALILARTAEQTSPAASLARISYASPEASHVPAATSAGSCVAALPDQQLGKERSNS